MAKQRTKTMEEQLEEMKAQLAKNQQELEAKKDELAKAKLRAEQPTTKKGKNGYVLRDAMQLTDDGARYQRLLRLVRAFANAYLPTGKTIANQEKTRIDKLIQLGGWPIHAILKQYLQNTTDKFNRDLRVEKAAEAQGLPAPSRRSRTHSEQPEQSDEEDEDDEADPDTDNIDMDVDDAASNQEKEDSFSQYDVDFPELADDSQMEDLRLEAASWDNDEIVDEPQAIPATAKQRNYCNDTLPANPSDELLTLFARKQEILKSSKPGSTYDLTRQIYRMIKSDNKRYACVQQAQRNSWAFNIDLDGLPDRVLELQDQLLDLICDDRALDECPIWRNFLEQISYKVHAFSLAEIGSFAPAADRAARCGYYGPTGTAISRQVAQKPHEPHVAFGHCAKPCGKIDFLLL
ncbi:hypothetical protein B0H14DRAFT_3478226 [Mycena olivaceomarginata]|nr:hypothetical protein B0H14DRAFT_3478226 [Mycena olivaceomarginata]